MSQEEDQPKFGTIEFQGKDISTPGWEFDRLAVSGRSEMLLVSLIAPTQSIKQIRSILNGGAKAICMAAGVKIKRPADEYWYAHSAGRLVPSADGYHTYMQKLGYGLAHALFVTKSAGFMKVVTPETLWQELNDFRFTTPLLRAWMPHIEKRLREEDLLEEAHVFGCNSGILSATTKQLDEIVSQGLRDGLTFIPRPAAVA